MPKDRSFDGFTSVISQDADADASDLPPQVVSASVNRTFRGGKNYTRPAFMEMEFVYANSDDQLYVEYGNFQGAIPYSAVKPGTVDGIVHAHAGRIFFTEISNNRCIVTRISDTFDPQLLHTWFVQAVDRIYIQNAHNFPLSWDGFKTNQCDILNPYSGEMPIGTFMTYGHGRVHLVLTNNLILSSDNIYSNGNTDTSATKNFTEVVYWANGGAFGEPLWMGQATGITMMPSINVNDSGQGELVVMFEKGAMTLNVSISPRTLWSTTQINRVGMIGRGNKSPWSICSVNGDVIYRSSDGWAFYSNSQAEFQQSLSFRKISKEVNPWINEDTPWMQQFASAIYFDNRIITTVSPYSIVNDTNAGWGQHRPHRAMLVADLEQSTGDEPDAGLNFRWNGLWTGIRPTQLLKATINSVERAFAFSFDDDGRNRLYEITRSRGDDYAIGRGNVPIKSVVIPKRLNAGTLTQKKTLIGGFASVSEVQGPFSISASYRGDYSQCWQSLGTSEVSCDPCSSGGCDLMNSYDIYKVVKFNTPKFECIPGVGNSNVAFEFQPKIELTGSVKLNRFAFAFSNTLLDDSVTGDCKAQDSCNAVECCEDDLYSVGMIYPA